MFLFALQFVHSVYVCPPKETCEIFSVRISKETHWLFDKTQTICPWFFFLTCARKKTHSYTWATQNVN